MMAFFARTSKGSLGAFHCDMPQPRHQPLSSIQHMPHSEGSPIMLKVGQRTLPQLAPEHTTNPRDY
jgi:hypothetical protein